MEAHSATALLVLLLLSEIVAINMALIKLLLYKCFTVANRMIAAFDIITRVTVVSGDVTVSVAMTIASLFFTVTHLILVVVVVDVVLVFVSRRCMNKPTVIQCLP